MSTCYVAMLFRQLISLLLLTGFLHKEWITTASSSTNQLGVTPVSLASAEARTFKFCSLEKILSSNNSLRFGGLLELHEIFRRQEQRCQLFGDWATVQQTVACSIHDMRISGRWHQ